VALDQGHATCSVATAPARMIRPTRWASTFPAHCAVCHCAPGVPKATSPKGLMPRTGLRVPRAAYSDGEVFWTSKHGIKIPACRLGRPQRLGGVPPSFPPASARNDADEYAKLFWHGEHRTWRRS